MKKYKYFLKGEKAFLRPYDEEHDAPLIFQWFNDPEVTYFMFTGQRPQTIEQIKELMKKDIHSEHNEIFISRDNKTGEAIGLVGLYEIHQTARKAEMRIITGNKEFWGKGYGTEITELINFYGFDRVNLNRIYLGITHENKGGIRAYEKAGYKHEGVLKEDIYRNSRYYDSVRMAILRDDYYKEYYEKHKEKFSIT